MRRPSFTVKYFLYMIAGLFIIASLLGVISYINSVLALFDISTDISFNRFDVFFTQCSVTFIVVSLVSFLCGTTDDVLWEDTIHYCLVNPLIFNFSSISAYLIANLFLTSIFMFMYMDNIVLFSFLISIFLISILTYRIIGAIFSRSKVKENLINSFNKKTNEEKKEDIDKLLEKTLFLLDEKEFIKVKENIDFLIKYPSAKSVTLKLMEEIGKQQPDIYLSIIKKYDLLTSIDYYQQAQSIAKLLIDSQQKNAILNSLISMIYTDVLIEIPFRSDLSVASIDSGITEHEIKEIADELSVELSVELGKRSMTIKKPLDLLYYAVKNSKLEVTNLIVNYLEQQHTAYMVQINEMISDMPELRNANEYNSQLIFEILWQNMHIQYLSDEQKDRIAQVLTIDDEEHVLLTHQKKILSKLEYI